MAPQQKGWSSNRWLVMTGLVLASMYGWWAFTQYGRLNDLNSRELADAGLELSRTIENAIETVTRFDPSKSSPLEAACNFQRDQPYLEFTQNCEKLTVQGKRFEKVRLETKAGLEIVGEWSPRQGKTPDPVHIRFRTDILLDELTFPESFAVIFVAETDGTVLYQDQPTQRRWLRLLRWGERGFRDSGAAQVSGPRIRDLAAMFGTDVRPSWAEVSSASMRTALSFAGEWHHLYTQPLSLANGDKKLVLGGIVPVRDVARQALAVETYFVALLSFILLLGVLGFPFIKLAALNPRERFCLRDVKLLYLSTGALLALFTFVVLAIDGYVRWGAEADHGLETLARDVKTRLIDEIGVARDRLVRYDRDLVMRAPNAPPCVKWPFEANWFAQVDPKLKPPKHEALSLEVASWVGPDGQQLWKITSDTVSDQINVGKRPYFRAVRDGNLYQVNREGPSFFIAPDRSITDGRFKTFLSIPSALNGPHSGTCPGTKTSGGGYIAFAAVQLLSVDRPPLPAGYGFAVVNREGRVLYHSDPRLSLRENFFSELSVGQEAKAMIYSGGPHRLSGRYRERPIRLHLLPLGLTRVSQETAEPPDAGLYVAAFRDLTLERAVVARAFVISLAGPLVVLSVIVVLALWGISWASWRFDGCRGRWLWPHGGLEGLYKRLTIVFLGVLIVGVVLPAFGATELALFALPVMAAVGGTLTYVFRDRNEARGVLSHARWHMVEFSLLALCMVMVPAGALFRLTLGHEFGTLIATERTWIDTQREDVVLALKAESRADQYPAAIGEDRAAARTQRFVSPPVPYHEDPAQVEGSAHFIVYAHEWIDRLLPVEGDVVLRQRYQDRDVTYEPPGLFGLRWVGLGWVAVVGIVATIAVLVGWVRWHSKRLFYCDVDSTTADPELPADLDAVWEGCSDDEQHLLMHVASERIANPYQRQLVLTLMKRGLLRLAPDLQPSTPRWDAFIRTKCHEEKLATRLRESERVGEAHSWGHVRTLLFVSLTLLAVFLIATQPGLQSDLVGIATGATAAATAILKLRETIWSWFGQGGTTT